MRNKNQLRKFCFAIVMALIGCFQEGKIRGMPTLRIDQLAAFD
jgi:hypothetical protein